MLAVKLGPAPENPTQARCLHHNARAGLVLLHLAFVLTGVVTTLLGPILPLLAAKWSLDDSLPWLVGYCSSHLGSLRFGLMVPMAASLAMLAIEALGPWRRDALRSALTV